MKVIINDGSRERPITIRLPLGLAANRVSSAIIAKNSEMSFEQAQALMKALKRAKKQLSGAPLVEVKSANGEEVTVYL